MQLFIDWLAGKKTYIVGVVAALLGVLMSLGFVTPEQTDEATQLIATAIERLVGLLTTIVGLIALVMRAAIRKVEEVER